MRIDRAVRFTCRHAADDVADGEACRSVALRLAQRRQRIGGLARLRDDDRQRLGRHDRLAVAVLRSVVDFDRNAGQLLDHELADQPRVPRRPAREDRDPLDRGQLRFGDLHFLEKHPSGVLRHAAEDRLAGRGRLLEDLLQHEVLVAGLLGHDRVPQHALRRLRHRPPEEVRKRHPGAGDDRHLLVAEEHDVARVAEDRRNVGRDEKLSVAEADDNRRSVADGDDLLGIVSRDEHEREQAPHQQQRPSHGVLEPVVLHLPLDQVGDDFRVGFGDEQVALALQFALQIQVVFDDPVVDDDDLAGAVAVRMRVLFGRTAVGRPSCVTDAVVAGDRVRADHLFEVGELAGAPPQVDRAVADHRDARRVVAPVLEAPQSVDEDGNDVLRSDVADDAAHR